MGSNIIADVNMVEKDGTSKLKLIHLVYGLIAAGVIIGIAIGRMGNQQTTNTKEIKQKVNKELFESHEKYQTQQFKSIQKTMDDGFDGLRQSIEKLAK